MQTHVACVKADRFPASVRMNASQTFKNCSSSGAIGAARTILVQRRERRGETIQILGLEDLLPHGLGGTLVVVNMVVPAARGLFRGGMLTYQTKTLQWHPRPRRSPSNNRWRVIGRPLGPTGSPELFCADYKFGYHPITLAPILDACILIRALL